jgi:uncharacterized repeat protein (TIGR03803 family)
LIGFFAAVTSALAAPTESVIANKLGTVSNLVGNPVSALYGVSGDSIFQLVPPAAGSTRWTNKTIYTFRAFPDGTQPGNLLLGKRGILYGTTLGGGRSNTCCGTVFALAPNSSHTQWVFSVLYKFKGGKDGGGEVNDPAYIGGRSKSQLIQDKSGALYGSTIIGGFTNTCCGTIFKLTPPTSGQTAWTKTTLHVFKAGTDGVAPEGALHLGANGALFGVTRNGGGSLLCQEYTGNGCGTVFELSPPVSGESAWTESEITQSPSVLFPYSTLVSDGKGALYGTSYNGGSGTSGFVYRITGATPSQPNGTFEDIYDFKAGTDGYDPYAGLIIDNNGALYGTTLYGGKNLSCPVSYGCGTVFKLTPTDASHTHWQETILHRFTGSDGQGPSANLLLGSDGALYGTAGVVFKIVQ